MRLVLRDRVGWAPPVLSRMMTDVIDVPVEMTPTSVAAVRAERKTEVRLPISARWLRLASEKDRLGRSIALWVREGSWDDDKRRYMTPKDMPRAKSTLTLLVQSIRFEPLQAIDMDGALREGVPSVDDYRDVWCEIHCPESWAANPDVAVIRFQAIAANIDHVIGAPEALVEGAA